jgi:hypothetical protein
MVVAAAVTAVVALLVLFSSEPAWAIPPGAFALFLGHLAGSSAYYRWPPRRPTGNATLVPSPDGTTRGVRFRYATGAYYWVAAVLALTALAMLAIAAGSAAGGGVGIAIAVLFAAPAVLLGWLLFALLRNAPGEIAVSPAGIFHRGPTFVHFVPWYAVHSVEAARLRSPVIIVKAFPSEDTGIRRFTGWLHTGELTYLPFMVIRTHWLGTDPATVYHALAYYHAHPDRRPELATPAALDRIAGGTATVR